MSETLRTSVTIAADADYTGEQRRANAVAVALEVIIAKAASSEGTSIHRELENLSGYADKIQEALKVK